MLDVKVENCAGMDVGKKFLAVFFQYEAASIYK